ncbi:MAG: RluA family pseudouridine synthase [Calditrichaeota bacterium]|nr:RluA family pseudouridine synthase [Calditrichota bacterium]
MTSLTILFEDQHVLVVIKPARVPSQSDLSGDPDMLTLCKCHIKENEKKEGNVYLGLVHRLDRPVGGIMIFAKRSKSAARISKQIQNRSFKKRYTALVEGTVKPANAELLHFLKKDRKLKKAIISDQEFSDAKKAILSYQLLHSENNRSLLEIDLKTGRFHQIRAQLSHIGHPIVGDKKYQSSQTHSEQGIALFASYIAFQHPISSELMEFEYQPNWYVDKIH